MSVEEAQGILDGMIEGTKDKDGALNNIIRNHLMHLRANCEQPEVREKLRQDIEAFIA